MDPDTNDKVLKENFDKLKEKVLVKRPVLAEILRKRGDKNLFEYASYYLDVNLNDPIRKRQGQFIDTFKSLIEKRLGSEIAEKAAKQMEKYYFVSTTDHHGPITHPFFINSNLVTAMTYMESGDPLLSTLIVLSCANVSLNNSTYPRGVLYTSFAKGKAETQRINFFPASLRLCSVYGLRPYNKEEFERARKSVTEKVKLGEVKQEEADKVLEILDEVYGSEDVLNCKSYSEQITKSNEMLWQKFFEKSGVKLPHLIYFDQEEVAAELLIKHHVMEHTIITHFLFDPTYDELLMKYFDGLEGGFNTAKKAGTYLFWALPKDSKYRIQLWKEGNFLVSEDGTYKLELTPENLKRALEEKEILPSMLLTFIVISFYYGVKCLGGFCQVNYLTAMKNAYIKLHADRENYRSIELCSRVQTKELCEDLTVAFMEGPDRDISMATGLDLILYGDKNTWETLKQESRRITLNEAIGPMMPDFYRVMYPDTEREADLMSLNDKDITRVTGLDKKIEPFAKIQL